MSSTRRDEILARIRAALRHKQRSAEDEAELERRLRSAPRGPHPQLHDALLDQFVAKAEANHFTVERVASLQMLVPAVQRLLAEAEAPPDISVAGSLASLGWPQDWTINTGPARMVEAMSVTMAVAGVAETGSVILRSDAKNPTTLNFLPDTHVIVLRASDVVAYLEDAWAQVPGESGDWPRTVNVISGPSRTADVGGVLVRPAHGPKAAHIVLVGE